MANVPITYGSGQSSIAGDTVATATYQVIKIADGTVGGTTGLIVNADGTANVRISGSVATAGGTFTGSVSGTVGASIIGTVPVVQSGTVITSVSGVVNVAGSVAAFQAGIRSTSISGGISSVALVGANTVSVVGTVGASIVGQLPAGTAVLGSVAALQGTNPWIITGSVQGSFTPSGNQSVSGTVQVDVRSSVAVVIIGGSIAASFTPPANQSVSGTVNIGTGGPVSVLGTMSVIGTVPVTQVTSPWIITGSVQGSFSPSGNQSVSGTVGASIIGQLPGGTAVLGSVAALQGTSPWTVVSSLAGGIFPISGSVAAVITGTPNVNTAGSVVAFQGTNPWNVAGSVAAFITGSSSIITRFADSSILAVPVSSTIVVFQAPSIVGTYAEDAASASGDKGFLVMGARNDTLASVTSADGDYSSHVVGPAGELIAENAPLTKWVSGTNSMLGGVPLTSSVAVIAAQGSSVFTYVTGVQIANFSSSSVLVSFFGATSSLIGYTIAPAGGGSNIYYQNGLKTSANAAFSASVSGTASIFVSAQGFISKT